MMVISRYNTYVLALVHSYMQFLQSQMRKGNENCIIYNKFMHCFFSQRTFFLTLFFLFDWKISGISWTITNNNPYFLNLITLLSIRVSHVWEIMAILAGVCLKVRLRDKVITNKSWIKYLKFDNSLIQ